MWQCPNPDCNAENADSGDTCIKCFTPRLPDTPLPEDAAIVEPDEDAVAESAAGRVVDSLDVHEAIPPPAALPEADAAATADEPADASALASYREAVESYCMDGLLDRREREYLRELRQRLGISPREAEQIEQQVQHLFRPRVRARVRRDTLAPKPVNEYRSLVFEICNEDRDDVYVSAECHLLIRQLPYEEKYPLHHFVMGSRHTPDFPEFCPLTPGTLDAKLRIVLQPREGNPVVLRSRAKTWCFKASGSAAGASQQVIHQHFQAGGDMRVVDASVQDKRMMFGTLSGTASTRLPPGDEQWQDIALEYDRETMEDLARADEAPVGVEAISRPACYRSGALLLAGPGGCRTIMVVAAAVVRMGRNRTHSAYRDDQQVRLNEIQLDLRSETLTEVERAEVLSTPGRQEAYRKYHEAIDKARLVTDSGWLNAMTGLLARSQRLGLSREEAEAIEQEAFGGRTVQEAIDTRRITGYAHLTLSCLYDKIILTDGSTYGTVVNRTLRLHKQEAEIEDRAEIQIAGVLELILEVIGSSGASTATPPDEVTLRALRAQPDLLSSAMIGFDKPGGVDALRLRRLNNLVGKLEHLVLIRQANIGSSPYDVIQLRDPRIQERHARLLVDRYCGQFWIEPLADDALVTVSGRTYHAGQRVGLVSGDVVELGDTRMVFEADPLG